MGRNAALHNQTIINRDGQVVNFDTEKNSYAIFKALRAVGKPNRDKANSYCQSVADKLEFDFRKEPPTVEKTQDCVEKALF